MNDSVQRPTAPQWMSSLGFAMSFLGFVHWLIAMQFGIWQAAFAFAFILVLCVLGHRWLISSFKQAHPFLESANPWLVMSCLLLSACILYRVWPDTRPRQILFDPVQSGLFNHPSNAPGPLEARGGDDRLTWKSSSDHREGSFDFAMNADAGSAPADACCGGFITFYGGMCNRSQYRSIRFRCRVAAAQGTPDLAVRLVVDNPDGPGRSGDREEVSYEIKSLSKYGLLEQQWQEFNIPIGDFEQVRFEPPFPPGLDANTINKVAFVVNNQIASQCSQAKFQIADIAFVP